MTFGHETTSTSLTAARIYGNGEIEEALGETYALGGLKIATKVWPSAPCAHGQENLAPTFRASLNALQVDKVDIFYLHAPDFTTPFEETLKAVDELYRGGLFNKAIRAVQLFGLAGHLDPPDLQATRIRSSDHVPRHAIRDLKTTAESLGISLVDATLRWMVHHSDLGPHDGIVMGASSVSRLKSNLDILAHGQPLPKEMVMAFDAAWDHVQPACPSYFKTEGVIKTYLPTAPDSSS
ncbi:hypothetical protein BG006_010852 [Podila minutissima]|uniref:NADP-dependent oxidoreductase domain-containing protein n=1 Tax=Podila minutissima TaxID=64525 RepID=A0A9P5SUB2_9FUNG|nr:hypothetical protein BG006_010852 [Podila minutissima]